MIDNEELKNRILKRCFLNQETGCMEWIGATGNSGYGKINANGKTRDTHRLMWELVNGQVPDGRVVMHTCDNRLCCAISHLSLGSQRENMQDASCKSRTRSGPKLNPQCVQRGEKHWTRRNPESVASGERNGMAKLTEDRVLQIRATVASGQTQRAVAREFGVSEATVSLIVHGKHWKKAS